MVYQDPAHIITLRTFTEFLTPLLYNAFFPPSIMLVITKEAKIILAIEAIQTSQKLSRRKAAKLYNILELSLRLKINSYLLLSKRRPGNIKLSKLKKEVIIRNILKLDSRGFVP